MKYSQVVTSITIRYRVSQFWAVLRKPQLKTSDLELAQTIFLIIKWLFSTTCNPANKSMLCMYCKTLQNQGETHPDLLTAALLHDVGK